MGALNEECDFGILDLVFIEERIVFAFEDAVVIRRRLGDDFGNVQIHRCPLGIHGSALIRPDLRPMGYGAGQAERMRGLKRRQEFPHLCKFRHVHFVGNMGNEISVLARHLGKHNAGIFAHAIGDQRIVKDFLRG